MKLSPKMIAALYEKAKVDGQTFPLRLTLEVGGDIVKGFMYEDGYFEEGETPTREGELDSATETGGGAV